MITLDTAKYFNLSSQYEWDLIKFILGWGFTTGILYAWFIFVLGKKPRWWDWLITGLSYTLFTIYLRNS